jgi:hypothetical protein
MTTELVGAPAQSSTSAALRVVLFGLPAAGKSSLLGALAQVAQAQESTLGFRLIDRSEKLAELRRRLYESEALESQAETMLYPVALQPLAGGDARRVEAVFVDCDGRQAGDLMTHGHIAQAPGPLAAEVRGADAIVFVVDASADAARLDSDLAAAVHFLKRFQLERGERTDVGGLPVFLVLSKCDLLATPGDDAEHWRERAAQKKDEASQRFHPFMSDEQSLSFGAIDLHLAATAIQSPGQSAHEPWGVADLFRKALLAASAFHQRRRQSQSLLFWTVLGALGFIALLAAVGAALLAKRESIPVMALEARIDSYRARAGSSAATRLSEPLQRKINELADIAADPEFPKVPMQLQRYVRERAAELAAYRPYKERLLQLRGPLDARSEEDLAEFEHRLGEIKPVPATYAADWGQTDAALLRKRWLGEIAAVRSSVQSLADWYRDQMTRAERLLLVREPGASGPNWTQWSDDANAILSGPKEAPPSPPNQITASWTAIDRAARRYPTVEQSSAAWLKARASLEQLRNQTRALGLTAGDGAPVLKLGESFTVAQVPEVLAQLKSHYPEAAKWSLSEVPEPTVRAMRPAIQAAFDRVIEAGRREFLRRLKLTGDGAATPERWRTVAGEVATAPEMHDWRDLADFLARWLDPSATNPVTALIEFVKKDIFDIEMRGIRLVIPDDLRENRLRPQGNFVVTVQHADKSMETLTFHPADEGVRDAERRTTTYGFAADGAGKLAVRPGDIIWAEQSLGDTRGAVWKLSWWSNGIRNQVYQLDRLALPPRMHRADQKPEDGTMAADVKAAIVPESGWPRLPDLLPEWR